MSGWFAHSHPKVPEEMWHALQDHLQAVGTVAGASAGKFNVGDLGRTAGLLHDLGKYSLEFQKRLRGEGRRVDHSTAGAKLAVERFAQGGRLIACAIAGHHARPGERNGDR